MTKKILIVEDENSINLLLCDIFEVLTNYQVTSVPDGEEALRTVMFDTPDIILLDVNLPGMNGHQLCEFIKADPNMSCTKVVMVSGAAQDSDWLKAERAGADDYITKPFSATALIKKVEALIGSK